MPDDSQNDTAGQIPTNLRLLVVLEEVAKAGVPVRPAAIGDALGLPKPTVHRLFQTAEAEGYLQRDIDGRSYEPGRRLRTLAGNVLTSGRVRSERIRILSSLADAVGETCNISIPDRDGMVYIERIETRWPLRIQLPIGSRVPFHCTASGKLHLSTLSAPALRRLVEARPLKRHTMRTITEMDLLTTELEVTRRRGFATDDEEFMDGMAAIAVPIPDDRGRLLATLSVHAPVIRHDLRAMKGDLDRLTSAATELAGLVLD